MNSPRLAAAAKTTVAGFALAALALSAVAQTQPKDKDFAPQVGQAGKDVIWVPTPEDLVERMLRMAQTTPNDFVVDLGSGDGRTVIAAAKKFGARSMGVEYNPDMVDLSNKSAAREGVTAKAKFIRGDIFETDFSQATVVTMYLLPGLNLKLRPRILDMKPGTRVVSHQFNMDDWQPDETTNLDGRRAYLWIVPAKVQGSWRIQSGADAWDLNLEQKYQVLEGSVRLGQLQVGLREPRLVGDRISFVFVDNAGVRREFSGRVNGSSIEGTVKSDSGPESRWTASRRT
ncbi:MAG TPA: class I SAM-dependent methyltransferase [Burkholderiales bacterium]|nr:class I SAM-dependent methyltransferase [Burkholderiales bacterium]